MMDEIDDFAARTKGFRDRAQAIDAALQKSRALKSTRNFLAWGIFIGTLIRSWREPLTGARFAELLTAPLACWFAWMLVQTLWARRLAKRIDAAYPLPTRAK